jgi:hypothetical protein
VSPETTTTVSLHNNTAETGTDCPDTISDYWHFVLTPNNGTLAFVSITLDLGASTPTLTGSDIIANGSQTDNVFVKVPSGSSLDDLQLSGSSAEVGGPEHEVQSLAGTDIVPVSPAPEIVAVQPISVGDAEFHWLTEYRRTTRRGHAPGKTEGISSRVDGDRVRVLYARRFRAKGQKEGGGQAAPPPHLLLPACDSGTEPLPVGGMMLYAVTDEKSGVTEVTA